MIPAAAWACLATFAYSVAGGIVPILNIEAYVIAVSAASADAAVFPVALAAAVGQMVAKSVVYLAGSGALKTTRVRPRGLEGLTARLARAEGRALVVVLGSALTSVPPLYAVSLAAGALRMRFVRFFVVGCAGGFVRFAVLFALPRMVL